MHCGTNTVIKRQVLQHSLERYNLLAACGDDLKEGTCGQLADDKLPAGTFFSFANFLYGVRMGHMSLIHWNMPAYTFNKQI
jgi:hypothetical protein